MVLYNDSKKEMRNCIWENKNKNGDFFLKVRKIVISFLTKTKPIYLKKHSFMIYFKEVGSSVHILITVMVLTSW